MGRAGELKLGKYQRYNPCNAIPDRVHHDVA